MQLSHKNDLATFWTILEKLGNFLFHYLVTLSVTKINMYFLRWFLESVGIISSEAGRTLFGLLRVQQDQFGLNFALKKVLVT